VQANWQAVQGMILFHISPAALAHLFSEWGIFCKLKQSRDHAVEIVRLE
jgi:hypothetical protein